MKEVKVQASTLMQRIAVVSRGGDEGEKFGPFLVNAFRNVLVSAENKVAQTVLTAVLNRLYSLL